MRVFQLVCFPSLNQSTEICELHVTGKRQSYGGCWTSMAKLCDNT